MSALLDIYNFTEVIMDRRIYEKLKDSKDPLLDI